MGSNIKMKEWFISLSESLNEQEWAQQLKGKWEELDPQSRNYLKVAGLISVLLLIVLVIISAMWNVRQLRTELFEKKALLAVIQSANDEMNRLRDAIPSSALNQKDKETVAWPTYFETLAVGQGIDKTNLTISSEKPGNQSDQNKEALFDLTIKHVNVKQLVRFTFSLESGQKSVKLRNLLIDAKDATGYLDATLAISTFTRVEP